MYHTSGFSLHIFYPLKENLYIYNAMDVLLGVDIIYILHKKKLIIADKLNFQN